VRQPIRGVAHRRLERLEVLRHAGPRWSLLDVLVVFPGVWITSSKVVKRRQPSGVVTVPVAWMRSGRMVGQSA
jgi:hypothetical protein